MEKVLLLSEKNTKMSPPQWIACQLHMSRINLAVCDWPIENARPMGWRGSLVLMTTTLLRRSWNKTSSTIHEFKRRAWVRREVTERASERDSVRWWHTIPSILQGWETFASVLCSKAAHSLFLACQEAAHRFRTIWIQTARFHIHRTIQHNWRNSHLTLDPVACQGLHNKSTCPSTIQTTKTSKFLWKTKIFGRVSTRRRQKWSSRRQEGIELYIESLVTTNVRLLCGPLGISHRRIVSI